MGISESRTGNQGGAIKGLILSQGCRLSKLPPPCSSGGGGWDASLPAVKFLQAFWFAFQADRKSQVADSPSLWAFALHLSPPLSPRTCAAPWPDKLFFLQQMNFKEALSARWRVKLDCFHTLQSVSSTCTFTLWNSIHQHYILSYYPHSEVQ